MAKQQDLETLRRRVAGKRWLWVERPTLLHARATKAGQCWCGCESWSGEAAEDRGAIVVETIPGPELLIDRYTGGRKLRADQSELDGTLEAFDELKRDAAHCDHVYMPRRCFQKQLTAIVARPKVKGLFGGTRGGKTGALAEEAVDQVLEVGGPGIVLWWVAPELADTMRCVRKLITGEAIKGGKRREFRPPMLDPRMVVSYPSNLEQVKRKTPIVLVDGTSIELRYAGRGEGKDGGNLKGDPVPWIGVDEGAEIMSPASWHTMIQRTTDSGGTLTTATTPKMGSPLKHLIKDEGQDLAANDGEYLTGYVHFSMLENPWITPANAQRVIDTLLLSPNGEDLVAQDIHGQWLVPGQRMWEHFDEKVHVVTGPWRDVDRYKIDGRQLRNITPMVAGAFFDGHEGKLLRVGGQDFNTRGHFTVVLQVGCPVGLDEGDPDNWVVYVEDEVKKAGEPGQAARHLAGQAGHKRQIGGSYFAKMAIACDSSGAQDQPRESGSGNVQEMFALSDAFVRCGFDMRPCHRSAKGKPVNPEKLAQQAILHMLMRRRDLGQDGPRYIDGDPTAPPSTRMIINKSRCPELRKGLLEQARNEKGFLRKRSDTRDDRLSDPVDALLYILWALYSEAEYYPRAKVAFN
jgi:hypothetical protein